jgi:hypothetical protein
MICDDNFHVSHSDTYYGIEFIKVLRPFKKFCKFYESKKHKDGISKHYSFDISWDKINIAENELVNEIKQKNNIDTPFKNIEYLFDTYFINNHLFIVPTENYSFIEYNTKTHRVEKHITHNNSINNICSIYNTCYTDMKISYSNYEIIKEFENTAMPIYKYCLPENISFFNYIYCESGDYGTGNSQIYALSDEYIYYIYIQK